MWKISRYFLGGIAIVATLWVARNALLQTRTVIPNETFSEALAGLVFGQPILGNRICPPSVHDRYVTTGPDGKIYPTWHPPVDVQEGCYFDHEHGSDPHTFAGFAQSGMPAFGYAAAHAGISEPHVGYKVYVSNNDLNGHAWMITLNQDSSSPARALARYHSLDWVISSLSGEQLVNLHLMADFGYAAENCRDFKPIPGSSGPVDDFNLVGHRYVESADCARRTTYEAWQADINLAGVFEATPVFDIDDPITAVDPNNLSAINQTCEYRLFDETCTPGGWMGGRRGVIHPGQFVHNAGPDQFMTDPYGKPAQAGQLNGLAQFVTQQGWDTRQCCGDQVVFRIQTYSNGVYIAAPPEPPGSAEFTYGPP